MNLRQPLTPPRDISDKNPYRIHASLSQHKAYHARIAIIEFFKNNLRITWIGNSSGDMRGHYLYRGKDGNLYNVHEFWGEIKDVFYFTEGDLDWAFEENPEGKPNWKMPDKVKREIARMNGINYDTEDTPLLVDDEKN